MKLLLATLLLCASPALADGPSSIPGNQCDEAFPDLVTYAAQFNGAPVEVVQAWYDVGLRAWNEACAPRLTQFSDAEKLAFVFSGHHVPEPSQVPLPGAFWMLAGALCLLRTTQHAPDARKG